MNTRVKSISGLVALISAAPFVSYAHPGLHHALDVTAASSHTHVGDAPWLFLIATLSVLVLGRKALKKFFM